VNRILHALGTVRAVYCIISVPAAPLSIKLVQFQNLQDPELIRLFQICRDSIEVFRFFITNSTINDTFIDAFLNLSSLKKLGLYSITNRANSEEIRRSLFAKLGKFSLQCLTITSTTTPGYRSIFDEELFTLLESKKVKCLHLQALNHYVERWRLSNHLYARAQITNLCIVNDLFHYHACEKENKLAPLYHTLADYSLLFPKLQFLCIGICIAEFDDNRLDSMLLCYYLNNSLDIKLRLTIRLFCKLKKIPSDRFDCVLAKLTSLQANFIFNRISPTDERITITSKSGNIVSVIIVCHDHYDVVTLKEKKRVIRRICDLEKCVELTHHDGNSIHCLCASNQIRIDRL
jgi:hypothetical protein